MAGQKEVTAQKLGTEVNHVHVGTYEVSFRDQKGKQKVCMRADEGNKKQKCQKYCFSPRTLPHNIYQGAFMCVG